MFVIFIKISSDILPRKFYFRIPLVSGGDYPGHHVKVDIKHLTFEEKVEKRSAGSSVQQSAARREFAPSGSARNTRRQTPSAFSTTTSQSGKIVIAKWQNRRTSKKCAFSEKSTCGHQRLTLEPPLPDEQRRSNGAPDGPDGSGNADRRKRGGRLNQ